MDSREVDMGTRHLTMVIQNKEPKVAQYGQWDGYPDGTGKNILEFFSTNNERYSIKSKKNKGSHNSINFKIFKDQIAKTKFLSNEELHKRWIEFDPSGKGMDLSTSKRFSLKYPALSRDTGSNVLQLIYDGKCYELQDSRDFAEDSLYCEWAYVIDLDKNTFEVYEGFNKESLNKNERFYNGKDINTKYYPVKHIHTFDLNNLPSEEKFLDILEEDSE